MECTDSLQIEEKNEINSNKEKSVFVSGIPYDTTEEDINKIFSACGVIKFIKMPKYQDTGRNIGYAHIYYKKNKSVIKVKLFNLGLRIEQYIYWTKISYSFVI